MDKIISCEQELVIRLMVIFHGPFLRVVRRIASHASASQAVSARVPRCRTLRKVAFFVPVANSVFDKNDFGETYVFAVEGALETPGLSPLVKSVEVIHGNGLT